MTTFASSWQDYSFASGRTWSFPIVRRTLTSIHDHFIPHERNNYHPHILSQRLLGLFSMMLVALKFAVIAATAFTPAATTYSSAITTSNVFNLTNTSRTEFNLPALTLNSQLTAAAQAKAEDMAAKGYFAHTSPDGRTPWSFIQATGYSYMTAGENLAVDFTQAENVETAWMNSPGHRANILNNSYEEIGIGIASGLFEGHNTTFVVQMFGTPAEQPVTFQSAPTQVAPATSPTAAATAPTPTVPVTTAPTATKPVTSVEAATKLTTKVAQAAPAPGVGSAPTTVAAAESKVTPVPPGPVAIIDTSTAIKGDQLVVTVTTSGPAVKVVADYNGAAILLDPKSETSWQGVIPLASLNGEVNLIVTASDMQGVKQQTAAASFTPSLQKNYQFLGNVKGATVSVLGMTFDPKVVEHKFYLVMIAGLLACMILAIAIKRHVQHVSLVANSSFVVILATLLWMAG